MRYTMLGSMAGYYSSGRDGKDIFCNRDNSPVDLINFRKIHNHTYTVVLGTAQFRTAHRETYLLDEYHPWYNIYHALTASKISHTKSNNYRHSDMYRHFFEYIRSRRYKPV